MGRDYKRLMIVAWRRHKNRAHHSGLSGNCSRESADRPHLLCVTYSADERLGSTRHLLCNAHEWWDRSISIRNVCKFNVFRNRRTAGHVEVEVLIRLVFPNPAWGFLPFSWWTSCSLPFDVEPATLVVSFSFSTFQLKRLKAGARWESTAINIENFSN